MLGDQFRGAGLGRAQALLDLSAPDRIEPQFGEGCEAGRFLRLQARDRIGCLAHPRGGLLLILADLGDGPVDG